MEKTTKTTISKRTETADYENGATPPFPTRLHSDAELIQLASANWTDR